MKRETALKKAYEVWSFEDGKSKVDDVTMRFADILQRECDQREGLIEMAFCLLNEAHNHEEGVPFEWDSGFMRWKSEYEKLKNV